MITRKMIETELFPKLKQLTSFQLVEVDDPELPNSYMDLILDVEGKFILSFDECLVRLTVRNMNDAVLCYLWYPKEDPQHSVGDMVQPGNIVRHDHYQELGFSKLVEDILFDIREFRNADVEEMIQYSGTAVLHTNTKLYCTNGTIVNFDAKYPSSSKKIGKPVVKKDIFKLVLRK